MESVGSNSSPPNPRPRFRPAQSFADRMVRALHHHLRLLHRSDSDFFVLGATGNVYIVTLSANPSCTCPDRATPCKHILFVFVRVLGVSLEDSCLRRRTLRECQLGRLLGLPTLPDAVAGASVRQRFHELFFGPEREGRRRPRVEVEAGTPCPVCLEEMAGEEERVVACKTCRNPIHEECLLRWRRSTGKRSASCVICRARWRGRTTSSEQDKYLNLSAYVDENVGDGGLCGG